MIKLLASTRWPMVAGMAAILALVQPASAQAPAAAGTVAAVPSEQELDVLVGPIALYPDDLVGLVLPASTYPLQIVEADRFLEARKQNASMQPKAGWDETVVALLNYPDVVRKMSTDLDWTVGLGEAVAADQGAVLEAIQRFRRKVEAAGNLKTDDKQVVTVEKEVITVVQADPQVIYVPSYNPSTVVVQSSTPVYGYYPTPYPVYYYPYAPGAMFATGMIFGAAIGAAWHANYHDYHVDVDRNVNANINRNVNANINRGNVNRGNVNRGQTTAWKPSRTPAQVSSGLSTSNRTPGGRVGDAPARSPGGGLGSGADRRPGETRPGAGERPDRDFGSRGEGARPSTQPADRADRSGRGGASVADRQAGRPSGADRQGRASPAGSDRQARSGPSAGSRDAFGGYQSGRTAAMDSQRGAASRGASGVGSRGGSSGGRAGGGRAGGGRSGGRGR